VVGRLEWSAGGSGEVFELGERGGELAGQHDLDLRFARRDLLKGSFASPVSL
jgi:hypothetical protein